MRRHRTNRLWGLIVLVIGLGGIALWQWLPAPIFDDIYQKASSGDSKAQFKLAKLYIWGEGVKKDPVQAHQWLLKAAEKGHAEAQNAVGESYSVGWGGEKDSEKAAFWYEKSAKQGNRYAQDGLARIYIRKEDYVKATYWLKQAAQAGNVESQFTLGCLYYYGLGVPQSYERSFSWTKKSADAGLGLAKSNLAAMYARGLWVEKDPKKALELYKEAVGSKYIPAAANVGYIYAYGVGVPEDQGQANYWYARFLTEANAEDLYYIADSFITGEFTEVSKPDAYLWMKQAAREGSKEAVVKLEALEQELSAAEKRKLDQQMESIKTGLVRSEN